MGEAKRRAAHIAGGGADWGMVGFKNSRGRRSTRCTGKMIFVAVRLERDKFGTLRRVSVNGTAKRATPRRHELRKVLRRAQSR